MMFTTSVLHRGWPHVLAPLLVTVLYALSVVTTGASRLAVEASRAGGAVPALNIQAGTSDPCNPGWSVISSPNVAPYNNAFSGVAAISANDAWAVGSDRDLGGPYRTLVEHWDGGAWSVIPSPNVGTVGSQLNGVAATSSNDAWAVGQYSNGTVARTLAEHWDGGAWSVIPSPNLDSPSNVLDGVAAVS